MARRDFFFGGNCSDNTAHPGAVMESCRWHAHRRTTEGSYKVDNFAILGAYTYASLPLNKCGMDINFEISNPTNPRLASSSKDGTVRIWSGTSRQCEYTIGGHTASVNIVRWGGGLKGKGVLYTASNDRTVRVWDASGVSSFYSTPPIILTAYRGNHFIPSRIMPTG